MTTERPLRVLHLLYKLGVGGMEEGVVKLANAHAPDRVRVTICSCLPSDELRHRLRPDVPVFEFERQRGNDVMLMAKLVSLLRRERPDIVHTHGWGTLLEGLVAARLARVRGVVHGEHGTMETRPRNLPVQRWAWHQVDRVLSVSSRLAERMAQIVGFPISKIQVIRNGVDLARFSVGEAHALRRELSVPSGRLIVGTVGRLVAVKNQAMLLDAFAQTLTSGIDAALVVAGEGPLLGELDQQARSLGIRDRVYLLGNRHDIPNVLAGFDLFVLSSSSEGLSNTLIEAMASGRPLVATRVGGADEIVEDGRTGVLVDAADGAGLARALVSLLRDTERRNRMGDEGQRRARAEFSLDTMLRSYEAVYASVAHAKGVVQVGR